LKIKDYELRITNYDNEQNEIVLEDMDYEGSDLQPVVNISWYDALVWCNAYTEWWNAQEGNSPAKAPAYIDTDKVLSNNRVRDKYKMLGTDSRM
jgi:hypothetical protein